MSPSMYKFLYDAADAAVIDGYGLRPDPELAQRNQERTENIKRSMGDKWICYRPIKRQQ